MREPLIIHECDNGYVLICNFEKNVVLTPVEDMDNEQKCLARMLEKVAEHFGFEYDPFSRENIQITFDGKGDEVE